MEFNAAGKRAVKEGMALVSPVAESTIDTENAVNFAGYAAAENERETFADATSFESVISGERAQPTALAPPTLTADRAL